MVRRLAVLLLGTTAVLTTAGSSGWGAEPRPAPLEVQMKLDKAEVTAGDRVRLRESVPAAAEETFSGVWHEAVQVGRFDPSTGLVTLKPDEYVPMTLAFQQVFDGLCLNVAAFHGFLYQFEAAGRKGLEFEFRPRSPGVYLLTTTWDVRGTKRRVTGPPVVLTVRPKSGGSP